MSSTGNWRGSGYSGRGTEPASAPRVAVYLRVSTGRQAEHDLSIPDQRRQIEAWAAARTYKIVGEYVDAATATDDKRPVFQSMIERACDGENAFDVIIVHSYSRFFRAIRSGSSSTCASSPSTASSWFPSHRSSVTTRRR